MDRNEKKKVLFHLNTAELTEWLSTDGDYTLDQQMAYIVEHRNGIETIKIFKDLIARSYGEKSLDGERFEKNEEKTTAFVQSAAYPVLFNELLTDADKAVEFFVGILPEDFASEVDKIMKNTSPNDLVDNIRPIGVPMA